MEITFTIYKSNKMVHFRSRHIRVDVNDRDIDVAKLYVFDAREMLTEKYNNEGYGVVFDVES